MCLMNEKSEISSVGSQMLMAFTLLLAGCNTEASVKEEPARPVKVVVVSEADQQRTLTYSGVVRPRIESAVGFRVPGKIVERTVNVGDRIEAGQLIARLDSTDLKLTENSAMAVLTAARTRRDVASVNLERAKPLLPKGFISEAAYDIRRNEMDGAASAVDTAEAQLRQASNAVAYAALKADRAGIVTAVTAEPGQVVSAGQPVISLAETGETEIAVSVPEQDAGRLTVGQRAKVTLWAGSGVSLEGRIREIAGQADAVSRTYAVRVSVSAPPSKMRLGMTASVAIRVDEEATAMVVPLSALTERDGGPAVFVVDRDSKAVRRAPVSVGAAAEDGVRISEGINPGDMVVTAGVQFLRDGMRVRVPGERSSMRPDRS
jgi:RND family efflux transporter MFP subunit